MGRILQPCSDVTDWSKPYGCRGDRACGTSFNIKMPSYQCVDPHDKNKTVSRPYHLYNGNSIPGKTVFILQQGPEDCCNIGYPPPETHLKFLSHKISFVYNVHFNCQIDLIFYRARDSVNAVLSAKLQHDSTTKKWVVGKGVFPSLWQRFRTKRIVADQQLGACFKDRAAVKIALFLLLPCSLMMCTHNRIHYGLMEVFICLHITLPSYHHYEDIFEGIELLKCFTGTFCRMCV